MAPANLSAIPKLPPSGLQRVRGEARLVTQPGGPRTRLATLYEEGAARIRLPHTHAGHLEAVLINTAGGLTGGDRLGWRAEAAPGTHLVLTTPASERIYRSPGDEARVRTQLAAGAGARLDWLPQETILFDNSALRRRLDIELAADATLLACEAVLLGRQAMGEAAHHARLADDWRVSRGGRLIHAEANRLTADPLERAGLSLLDGAAAFATLLYIGADAACRLETIRALGDAPGLGNSLIGEKLVLRAMAPSGLALRRIIVPIIDLLSGAGAVPRLWNI
ncbi:MAG TPA: urease accessory protein UreD [Devosia sp.]|nr:urease accessory protein UreD [Devosia sp.]